MKRVTLHIVSETKINAATTAARWDHPTMGRTLTTTQTWAWRGGDAIVAVVGPGECWVALRINRTVRVLSAPSIRAALAAYGYEVRVA